MLDHHKLSLQLSKRKSTGAPWLKCDSSKLAMLL